MALLGYGLATVWHTFSEDPAQLAFNRDTWMVVLCLLALRLWSVGRISSAGTLILAVVLLEAHVTFVLGGTQNWPTAALMLPLLNFVAGLWLGKRISIRMAVLTVFTVPLCLHLSGIIGLSRGWQEPGIPIFLITLAAVTLATQLLLISFLSALGEVLRRSEWEECRARELIDGTPDAIVVLGPDGRVENVNDATALVMGLERNAIIGRHLSALPITGPGGASLDHLLENGDVDGPIDLSAGMGRIPLETLVRPLQAPGGKPGKLLVLRDISKRREAEKQARTLQQQLQQAQKMEAVGLLAGGIAHDFNNLLTAVGGYGSLLAMSADPESREFGTEIQSVQKRGSALIRQLLTFARRDTSEPRVVDLSALVEGCSPLVRRLIGERTVLRVDTPQPCPIRADPGRIEQVLLNLAANARDAMRGGGTLEIRTRLVEPNQVVLEFEDTGEGISSELQERIFEPFFTTKAANAGTGLGLAAVHGIVTAAHGTITVTSAPGQGTCFVITLPRSDLVPESAAPSVRPRDHAAGTGCRIMLVEDNLGVRTYLKRLLEHVGYNVDVYPTGQEAWESLQTADGPPDLLLSDVIMPRMTGPELVRLARTRWPDLPYLLISGYLGDDSVEADWAGLDPTQNLLMKPFADADLLDHVERRLIPSAGNEVDPDARASATGP